MWVNTSLDTAVRSMWRLSSVSSFVLSETRGKKSHIEEERGSFSSFAGDEKGRS